MASTRTSVKKTSRERARLKRAELDVERARRDAAIEDAAASFYDADDARAALLSQLDEIDQTRGLAVAALAELKESNQRIAQLLEIPAAEVRRLRELVEAAGSDTNVAATDGGLADGAVEQDDERFEDGARYEHAA